MFQPLKGIRVIDLSQVLAGPYATYQLALLGAEVIKIEMPPNGDWARNGNAPSGLENQKMGTGFLTQNANKKSIALDLKNPPDHTKFLKLVKISDIFVENFRPGTASRLGISYKDITKIKPNILYCSISAYGQDGPIGHRPAYDHIVQGMCGIMETTGVISTTPNKVGAPYIDYATGLNAAFGIVSALHEVKRTGKSIRLDVAMLDTALMLMLSLVTNHLNTGWKPVASGNEAWSGSPSSGAFGTTSGILLIAANNERQFKSLCHAIDVAKIMEDERFINPSDRKINVKELRNLIATRIAEQSAEHWEEILNKAAVPAVRIRSLDQVLDEPQVKQRKLTSTMSVPGAHNCLHMPTLGFKINGEIVQAHSPPPKLNANYNDFLNDE